MPPEPRVQGVTSIATAATAMFPAPIDSIEVVEVCVPKRERNRISAQYGIGIGDASHMRGEVEFGREMGFRHFKTKVGAALADDLARVEALTSLLQPGETLGVDANAGWSMVAATQALGPLHDLGVLFL